MAIVNLKWKCCSNPIPVLTIDFQKRIQKMFQCSHFLRLKANQLYEEQSTYLYEELDFSSCLSPKTTITTKPFSESFLVSGRLDAEYYQPKYEDFSKIIKKYKFGFITVGEIFKLVKDKCNRSKLSYKYIEIGDIDIGTGKANFNIIKTEELPDNAKIMTKQGDIVISTVRPNRGAVAILEESDFLVSGAFTVLREKAQYKKEVLQVLFRTELYRKWLLKYNVGTSYPVIKDADIINMPVPLLSDEIQQEIAEKVQQSFSLRKQAEHLIETAVKAVEIAIENGEETATDYLNHYHESFSGRYKKADMG